MLNGEKLADQVEQLIQTETEPKRRRTRRPKVEMPPSQPVEAGASWRGFGPVCKSIADPLYRALGVEDAFLPSGDAWAEWARTLGAVVEHYLPTMTGSPWPPFLMATMAVTAPALVAWSRRKAHVSPTAAGHIQGVSPGETVTPEAPVSDLWDGGPR